MWVTCLVQPAVAASRDIWACHMECYKGGVGVNTCTYTHTHVYFLKSEPKYFIVAAGEFSAPGTGQALIAVNLKET